MAKRKKCKQWSTKHYTGIYRSSNTNPTKSRRELWYSGNISSSCSINGIRRVKWIHE